jgi:hypothetical protein
MVESGDDLHLGSVATAIASGAQLGTLREEGEDALDLP